MAGITIDNQPVLLDPRGELQSLLDRRWPELDLPADWKFAKWRTKYPFGTKADRLFGNLYPALPLPKINQYIHPTGASRHGLGLFVMGDQQMGELLKGVYDWKGQDPDTGAGDVDIDADPDNDDEDNTYNLDGELPPLQWGEKWNPSALAIEDADATALFYGHILTPILLDPMADRKLWLVAFVDIRYLWQTPVDLEVFLALTAQKTWNQLEKKLEADAIAATPVTIGLEFGTPPVAAAGYKWPDRDSFLTPGITIGEAMDGIALSTGRRYVFSGESSPSATVNANLRSVSHADDIFSANQATHPALARRMLGNIQPRGPVPDEIELLCPKWHEGYLDEKDLYPVSLTLGDVVADTTGHSVYKQRVYTTFFVKVEDDIVSSLERTSAEALLSACIDDLIAAGNKQYAVTFAGVVSDELMHPREDYWSYAARQVDGRFQVTTSVRTLPPEFAPRALLCQRENAYIHPDGPVMMKIGATAIPARTDTTIPAGSLFELSSGDATACWIDPADNKVKKRFYPNNDEVVVKAFHAGPGEVEAGAIVHCKRVGNHAVIDVEYC